MAQIRHIAISSDHPGKTAEFFKRAFSFREIARHGFDVVDGARSQQRSALG
jgi:hypothetical protein